MCSSPADADRYLIMTQPARIEGTPYLHEISPPENELLMLLIRAERQAEAEAEHGTGAPGKLVAPAIVPRAQSAPTPMPRG